MTLRSILLALLASVSLTAQTPRETLQRNVGTNTVLGTNAGVPFVVTNIAALKATDVSSVRNGQITGVAGYRADGDGGGGDFAYNSVSSATDDGGCIIAPTNGTGRWIRVLTNTINVKWFGAYGDGTHDDTASIQSAITAANRLAPVYSGSDWIVPPTQPEVSVLLPNAKFLISAKLTCGQRIRVHGDNCFLVTVSSITMLEGSGFGGLEIDGIHFGGGTNQISVNNPNLSGCFVHVHDCYFEQNSGYEIMTNSAANSTTLWVNNCFFNPTGAQVLLSYCDQAVIESCWVNSFETGSETNSEFVNYGGLVMKQIFFTPSGATVAGTIPWIDNSGKSLKCAFCRFGGELGGKPLATNRVGPASSGADTIVDVQRNSVWGVNSQILNLANCPDRLTIRDNDTVGTSPISVVVTAGYSKSTGFVFDCDEHVQFDSDSSGGADLSFFRGIYPDNADAYGTANLLTNSSALFDAFSEAVVNLGTGGSRNSNFDDSATNPLLAKGVIKVITGSSNSSGNPLRYFLSGSSPTTTSGKYTFGFYYRTNVAMNANIHCGYNYKSLLLEPTPDYGVVWVTGYINSGRASIQIDLDNMPFNATIYLTNPFEVYGVMSSPKTPAMFAIPGTIRHPTGWPAITSPPGSTTAKTAIGSLLLNAGPADGQPFGWVNTTGNTTSPTFRPFGQMGYRTSTGAPSFNSYFIGEEALDTSGHVWYKSVATGTGASDWQLL